MSVSAALHTLEEANLPELAIAHWWRFSNLNDPLRTSDGRSVRIVFRGVWSHGVGPDFRHAMVAFGDAELHAGSIEIHRTSGEWRQHGHDLDPVYNDVVLHVVLFDHGEPTRRADGSIVPVVVAPVTPADLHEERSAGWAMVGRDVCAAALAESDPAAIRAAVYALGDLRLGHKSARIEARLANQEPGEVLYQELLEALGYSANREPMRAVALRVPLQSLTALAATVEPERRGLLVAGALLGTGGFLPLSPQLQEIAGLTSEAVAMMETLWRTTLGAWHGLELAPTSWQLTRMRPLNHPVRRLLAAAQLTIWNDGALLPIFTSLIREGGSLEHALMNAATWQGSRLLGPGRARAIVANAVIPFAMAFAAQTGDDELSEAVSRTWENVPGEEPNQATRRALRQIAGNFSLGIRCARGMQGLLHLDSTLCAPRRCFECPIAHLVIEASP